MRRGVITGAVTAAALLVPVLAAPASAQEIVYVRSTDSGVAAGVKAGTGTLAGASASYDGVVCLTIGVSSSCIT